jgi:hypothetical protein
MESFVSTIETGIETRLGLLHKVQQIGFEMLAMPEAEGAQEA